MVYIPKKAAFILMIVLGTMCLADGLISKHDLKEGLIGAAVLIYGIVSLVHFLKLKKQQAIRKVPLPGTNDPR